MLKKHNDSGMERAGQVELWLPQALENKKKTTKTTIEKVAKPLTQAEERFISGAALIRQVNVEDANSIGFHSRLFVQASLPHRDPGDVPVWGRSNGNFGLTIQPGYLFNNGVPQSVGLPFGNVPRLLMTWIASEVVKKKSPTVYMANNLAGFMRDVGLGAATGGRWGTITRLKHQSLRFFSARFTYQYNDAQNHISQDVQVAKKRVLWWDEKQPDQRTLFANYIVLDEEFFRDLIEHNFPVDLRALKLLQASCLGLDLYTWLTYRMSYLKKRTPIPWQSLQGQFGADYDVSREFTRKAKVQLNKIRVFWPNVDFTYEPGRLILSPSATHIKKFIRSVGNLVE
jgi:Plasmid encoded RepA protein